MPDRSLTFAFRTLIPKITVPKRIVFTASVAIGSVACAALFAAAGASPAAQAPATQARIVGVAHMAYYVSNVQKARDYYEKFLGFDEAFTLSNPDGSFHAIYIKINDHQYIVLHNEPAQNHGFIHDAAFETDNAEGMREHLDSAGIKVPDRVARNAAGNLSFDITDPSGFTLELVQYKPDSMTGRTAGKFMPATRISDHVDHIGLLMNDRERAWAFYNRVFGFIKEGNGTKMDIPGSTDRFELGFEKRPPVEARYHVKDHICLSNPDVPKMTAELRARAAFKEFPNAIADVHKLSNGKNVIEIYDQDHNRIEVMEPPKPGEAD